MPSNEEPPTGLPATFVPGFHDEAAVRRMQYTRLGNTDMVVSKVGLGGCPFGNLYGDMDMASAKEVAREAIKSGINFIDTAPFYGSGRSEEVLGEILQDIPRKAYYLATKVGRYGGDLRQMFDYSADRVLAEFPKSLERLKVDYVDLIQIHDIEFSDSLDILVKETLPALGKCVAEGKARYIGFGGYDLAKNKELIERSIMDKSSVTVDTVITYCRATLMDCTLEEYIPYFKSKHLGVINASPSGMGLLTNQGPQNWHPGTEEIKQKSREAAQYCKDNGVSIAKIANHYAAQFSGVHTTLLGVNTVAMLKENIDAALDKLSPQEQECMNTVRYRYFGNGKHHWEGVEIAKFAAEIDKLDEQK